MHKLSMTCFLVVCLVLTLPGNSLAQSGISLTSAVNRNIAAGSAAGIQYGSTTVRNGVQGSRMSEPKSNAHTHVGKDCNPDLGICKAVSLNKVLVSNTAIPKQSVLFIVDSVHGPNLAMLVHLDSVAKMTYGSYFVSFVRSSKSPTCSYITGLNAFYPGAVNAFSLPFEFSIDAANASKLNIATDTNGLVVHENTLCLIQTFATDTNFYKITFLGTIGNAISLKMGNPNSNCDSTELGICDIFNSGGNRNYAFYDMSYYNDDSLIVNFYVNQTNINNTYPSLTKLWENYDGELPGSISFNPQGINFDNYSYLAPLHGWRIIPPSAGGGGGTSICAGWYSYFFYATRVLDTDARSKRAIKKK